MLNFLQKISSASTTSPDALSNSFPACSDLLVASLPDYLIN